MSFSIQTNTNALMAEENMRLNSNFQNQTIQRLTSGYRINKSGDDAAGLAVANKFRSNVSELTQGVKNANDGISQLQIMDSGINNIATMLDRLKTLATQSASSTFTGDRSVLNKEYQTLVGEIDRQAQGIGLGTGGHFAQSMGVYIGGGSNAAGAGNIQNGTVMLDLAGSVVDSKALGLRTSQYSVQVDSSQSIANIVNANSGDAGTATFKLSGPGFTNTSISVSLGTSDTLDTLATKLNYAIQVAGNAGTTAANQLRAANIQAGVVTDSSGNKQLSFTSATTAFQVSAGTNTANALLGNFDSTATNPATGASVSQAIAGSAMISPGATANESITLKVFVNGTEADVHVGITSGVATLGTVLDSSSSTTLAGVVAAGISASSLASLGVTAKLTSDGKLQFTGNSNQSITVQADGDTKNVLGFGTWTEAGKVTTGTNTLTAASATETLSVTIGSTTYALTAALTAGNTAGDVFTALKSDTDYSAMVAAGVSLQLDSTNHLQLVSSDNVTFSVTASGAATAGASLTGFGSSASATVSSTLTTIASNGFTTASGENANVAFSINGGQKIVVSFTGGADKATTAANFQAAIDQNTELKAAGLKVNASTFAISSSGGAKFRMNVESQTGSLNLGFGTGQLSTATYMAVDKAAMKAADGSAQTGLGDNNDVFSFTGLVNSGATGTVADQQVITFSATDPSGVVQTVSSTLNSSNAVDVDQAVAQINSDLQNSGNATLMGIVAVKQTNVAGTAEGIRFISSNSNFSVNVGTGSNSTQGSPIGLYDGTVTDTSKMQGMSFDSSLSGSIDISTEKGAAKAVSALAGAIEHLGIAQAAVGKGQNQLGYAISLAQAQITNFSSAESQIRDADVAAEAANLSKAQVLQQAAIAAMAQANSAPQTVLSLLK